MNSNSALWILAKRELVTRRVLVSARHARSAEIKVTARRVHTVVPVTDDGADETSIALMTRVNGLRTRRPTPRHAGLRMRINYEVRRARPEHTMTLCLEGGWTH